MSSIIASPHDKVFRASLKNVAIWQFHRKQTPKAKKLPLIINLVFYSGKAPYLHSLGQIPSRLLEQIENASSDELLDWSDKVIEAEILEDIFENYH